MVVCSVFFAEREANATRIWLKGKEREFLLEPLRNAVISRRALDRTSCRHCCLRCLLLLLLSAPPCLLVAYYKCLDCTLDGRQPKAPKARSKWRPLRHPGARGKESPSCRGQGPGHRGWASRTPRGVERRKARSLGASPGRPESQETAAEARRGSPRRLQEGVGGGRW